MSEIALLKNKEIVVSRTGSSEQLVKIKLVDLERDKATLEFSNGSRVSIHTSEEWDQMQADRRSGKSQPAREGPSQQAPYMN
jgi:hypothetical protein